MADGFRIEIVAPDRQVMGEQVRSATVPAQEGYFTVLGEHAPTIALLKPGFATVVSESGETHTYFLRGGSVEVSPDGVTILAEQAQHIDDFDRAKIEEELRKAQEELAAAATAEAREAAQSWVDTLKNFIEEVAHMTPPVSL